MRTSTRSVLLVALIAGGCTSAAWSQNNAPTKSTKTIQQLIAERQAANKPMDIGALYSKVQQGQHRSLYVQ